MSTSRTFQDLLRLAPHESRVLAALTEKPQRPKDIVLKTGVPNASAYLAVTLLCERGLAEKKKVKNKTMWLRASPSSLVETLSTAINELEHVKNASVFEIKHKEDTSVIVHRGANSLRKVIQRAISLHTHERYQIVQGANHDSGWMKVVGKKTVFNINQALKAKEIIGESFIPENYFKNLVPYWGREWAESYVDRLNIAYLIPSEFMPSYAEIILFRDRVLIMHMRKEIVVEVKDPEMLLLFKMLLEYIKTFARKVDPRAFLEEQFKMQ